MIETVICICGLFVLGGIILLYCSEEKYSEAYYHHLHNNKGVMQSYLPTEIELYRYF
jgi:hypothetical protein